MARTAEITSVPCDKDVVAFLEHEAFGQTRRIDTHAAHIFLTKDRAWKSKQPVNLGFLDFSTPEKRQVALEAELQLNRRTAPDLYLGLHRLTWTSNGGLRLDGEGAVVDWVLEMRRFPDEALLDRIAGHGLGAPLLMRLADVIAAFHEAAEPVWEAFPEISLKEVIAGNAARFATTVPILPATTADRLIERQAALLLEHSPLLAARTARGRVRHVHGDLHLRNIALIDGEPVPFDCLEFNPELATIDVAYDLAFLLMDLWHCKLRNEANIVINRYLDISTEDEDCVPLMPLFMSLRAAIRAHVMATQAQSGDTEAKEQARAYLDLALELIEPRAPRIVAIGGLSGTGKSTLARALGGTVGHAPGARILRSDVLRKRAAGLRPEEHLSRESYTALAARQSYRRLAEATDRHVQAGTAIVADAAFAQPSDRRMIVEVASAHHVPFHGFWLDASCEARIERVRNRRNDASDADEAVVRSQADVTLDKCEPWIKVSANEPPDIVAARVGAMIHAAPC